MAISNQISEKFLNFSLPSQCERFGRSGNTWLKYFYTFCNSWQNKKQNQFEKFPNKLFRYRKTYLRWQLYEF